MCTQNPMTRNVPWCVSTKRPVRGAEVRPPVARPPGRPAKEDTEYVCHGVAEILLFCEPLAGRREAWVTEHRTPLELAQRMEPIVQSYPQADRIRVVMDTLNTPKPGSLYDAFPPEKAHAILKKREFRSPPKHRRWLNMAKIEFSARSRQCLDPRLPDSDTLAKNVAAWGAERNRNTVPIRWLFTPRQARDTMARCYPPQSVG